MGIGKANGQSEGESFSKPRSTRVLKSEQSETIPSANRAASNILQEMTSFKFEGIYMNMMCLLIKEGGEVYNLALSNLIKYCSLSRNKFNNNEQIEEIMKVLTYHIETNDYLMNSMKAFKAVLCRVRESYIHKHLDNLKIFI